MKALERKIKEYTGEPRVFPVRYSAQSIDNRLQLFNRDKRIAQITSLFSDISTFLCEMNKDVLMNRYNSLKTLKSACSENKLKLSEINQAYGEGAAESFLVPFAIHIQEACGLKDVTELQCKVMATAMYEELFFLSLPELIFFVKRISFGKYGQFYGKLTPQHVTEAAIKFKQERAIALEQIEKDKRGISEPIQPRAEGILKEAPDYCVNIAKLKNDARNNKKLKRGLRRIFDK